MNVRRQIPRLGINRLVLLFNSDRECGRHLGGLCRVRVLLFHAVYLSFRAQSRDLLFADRTAAPRGRIRPEQYNNHREYQDDRPSRCAFARPAFAGLQTAISRNLLRLQRNSESEHPNLEKQNNSAFSFFYRVYNRLKKPLGCALR